MAKRVFKLLSVVPGLKTICDAIGYSMSNLRDIAIYGAWVLAISALFGLHLYMGRLKQTCIENNSMWVICVSLNLIIPYNLSSLESDLGRLAKE